MKRFDKFRARRRQIYEGLFSARVLCIAGFLIMPAILFNPVTPLRVLQFLFFWFLAWLSGKKNNPLITLIIIFGIVAFNLIVPYGQVLFSIGVFKITFGALMTGIHRAVTLEGLIMLSRVTIRRDLKIPGRFGDLIGESFRIFAVIMDQKQRITRKNFISDIDRLMLELSADDPSLTSGTDSIAAAAGPEAAPGTESEAKPQVKRPGTKPLGFVILALVVILSWLPWVILLFAPAGN